MQRVLQVLGLSGALATGLVATNALAADPPRAAAEEPKVVESPVPPAPTVAADASAAPAPAAKPKFGDTSTSGYFRGGFGASSQKGRMTCFQLALNGGLLSESRLGNECEVWAEYGLTTVVYAGKDGSVAQRHFMPAAFIPTTYAWLLLPTGVTSSDLGSPGTGATVAFPNLYVDIRGMPWLYGGTAWAATRYYKRENIYISDFFYWNPSGVGAGVEDINLGGDLRLSYAVFAVDGQPSGSPQVPSAKRSRHPKRYPASRDQALPRRRVEIGTTGTSPTGVTTRTPNGNSVTHRGLGRHACDTSKRSLGGDNKFVVQYGRGGGTGFGTLARFYYPDFSLRQELRITTAHPRCGDHSADRVVRRSGGFGLPARRQGHW